MGHRWLAIATTVLVAAACGGGTEEADGGEGDAAADASADARRDAGEQDAGRDAGEDGDTRDADVRDAREPDGDTCVDADGDGHDDVACGGDDCEDSDPTIYPGQTEPCDETDNDCDGSVDEGATTTYYRDADGDGFGAPDETTESCARPEGYAENGDDCDDSAASVHPASSEVCDGSTDEDCDGTVDEGCACTSGDTRSCSLPGRCAAGTETCTDGAWSDCSISPADEECNGEDDDCDGSVDEGC